MLFLIATLLGLTYYGPIAPNSTNFRLQYNLQEPNQTFNLPKKLKEVSGLSLSEDGKHLIAIQDENGLIFFVNKETGEVDKRVEFWKDGDYEGVEVAHGNIYVVKSSGTIYKITQVGATDQKVEKFNQFLNKDHDVEGLAFDAKSNRLLMACKAKAGLDGDLELKKGIYAFCPEQNLINRTPAYTVSLASILAYLETNPPIRKLEKVIKFFKEKESDFSLSPSAIAIHPLTGNIYITSSVGKLLLIISPDSEILHIEKLKKGIHPQPEGICFDAKGNLYIANEGKKETPGKIYQFAYN